MQITLLIIHTYFQWYQILSFKAVRSLTSGSPLYQSPTQQTTVIQTNWCLTRGEHWQLPAWFRCDNGERQLFSTMTAPQEVGADTAIRSVISELESISPLKEEQRMTLKVFLMKEMSLLTNLTQQLLMKHTNQDGGRTFSIPQSCWIFHLTCTITPTASTIQKVTAAWL